MGRTSQGFTEVLYIRVSFDLVELLDHEVERQRKEERGRVISRSDVVREILYREFSEEHR